MPAKCFTPEQIVDIRNRVKSGQCDKYDIAREFNIGERSVRNLINGRCYGDVEGAFALPRKNEPLATEKKQEIERIYNETRSMYKTAEITGVARNTVLRHLRGIGIDTSINKGIKKPALPKVLKPKVERKAKPQYIPAPISDRRRQLLCNQHNAGWSHKEIAEMLDMSVKDVKYYLQPK